MLTVFHLNLWQECWESFGTNMRPLPWFQWLHLTRDAGSPFSETFQKILGLGTTSRVLGVEAEKGDWVNLSTGHFGLLKGWKMSLLGMGVEEGLEGHSRP